MSILNQKNSFKIMFGGFFVLALGTFTSVSFSSLSHILFLLSGLLFSKDYLNRKEKVSKSFYFLLALSLTCICSVVVNLSIIDNPIRNIFKVKYFLIALLVAWVFPSFYKSYLDDKKISLLIKTFIVATSVATISGIIGVWTGFNPLKMKLACHEFRNCGLFGMYMTYGYGIALYLSINVAALFFKKELERWISKKWLKISFFINLFGLYLSFARGAWLGVIASILFCIWFWKKKLFLVGLLMIFLLGISSYFFVPKFKHMLTEREGSNQERIAFYQAAFAAFKEKPIFGYGFRNFEPNVTKIKKRHRIRFPEVGGHAHSNFLEHLASTGAIGATLFLLFCLFWFWESLHSSLIISSFIVCFFISGLFQYTFGDGENLFLIMGVYSISQGIRNSKNE